MYGDLKVKARYFYLPDPDLMPSPVVILSEFPDELAAQKTRMMRLSQYVV